MNILLAIYWMAVFVLFCSGYELPRFITGCAFLVAALGNVYEYLRKGDPS